MRLPKKDTSTWRGLVTSGQTFIASIPVILGGLWMATKAVPGCNEAILLFLKDNWILIAGTFGVSSGVASFVWNLFRKDVKNY